MPASHTPSDRPAREPSRQPSVPRPRGPLLDAIELEGISWEGQALIVGQDGDIPALLYVTSDRLVLTNRDTVLLEVPRAWLVPAPLRVQDNRIRFSITPEGVVPGPTTTERLLLTIREGRGPASQLLAILTGRARRQSIEAEFPTWKDGVGAGRASTLPPLPAFEATQDAAPARRRDTADAETRGVAPIEAWESEERPQAQAKRVPFRAPEPEPVAPQSRAARFISTREAQPEPERAAPAPAPARKAAPAKVTRLEEERQRRGAGMGVWATRIAMLLIVALVAGWFARPYLPDEITDRLPALEQADAPSGDVAMNPAPTAGTSANAADGDGTNGAGMNPADIMPTEAALGVGGATSEIPDGAAGAPGDETLVEEPPVAAADESEAPAADVSEPVAPEDPDAGADAAPVDGESEPAAPEESGEAESVAPPAGDTGAGEGAGEPPVSGNEGAPPVVVPTQAPVEVVEPTAPPVIEEPVEEPTEVVPTPLIPTEEPTPEPTIAPTEEPTVAPTEQPTVTPTEEATEESPTIAPTGEPVEEPTLESQPPSVSPDEEPAQQFVEDGIRYSVTGAASGTTVEELPDLAPVTYGEWVVLELEAQNWTAQEQIFDMREFTLLADGQPIQVDVGNSWVASLLGHTPAYGNTDAILWAPGEAHGFVLTFLAPPDAQSLVLQAGDQQFDLSSLLETTGSLSELRQGTPPETIDATVAEVVDAETIVIEKDGVRQEVRYLGVDTPSGDDCYAAEALEAHRALVEGRNVKIERQATDTDAQGRWVRDVWVETDDGTYVLVAHQMVQQGAAQADISEPNTRFASWLRGAESVAMAEGRGLWGACQQGDAGDALAIAPGAPAADRRGLI